jgi:ribosome recycling factor
MLTGPFDLHDLETRMRASLEALKRELSGLRTGRASTHLLDPVQVSVYGSKMPLNQLATISVPEPRTISVRSGERASPAVDKAIREANSASIRSSTERFFAWILMTAERRQELAKLAQVCRASARGRARPRGHELLKKLFS